MNISICCIISYYITTSTLVPSPLEPELQIAETSDRDRFQPMALNVCSSLPVGTYLGLYIRLEPVSKSGLQPWQPWMLTDASCFVMLDTVSIMENRTIFRTDIGFYMGILV